MLKMQTDVAKMECVVILFKYLTLPYGGGQVLLFFSLRMLISLMESEKTADAQDRTSFFHCYVVGCAVFPLETNFQWSYKNKSKPQLCFGDLMCKRKVYSQLNRVLIFLFWPSVVSVHVPVCNG